MGDHSARLDDQFAVNAAAEPFDINSVNQELCARVGQFLRRFCRLIATVGELLPAVRHHEVVLVAPAAAQVQDEMLLPDRGHEASEVPPIHLPFAEDVGGDNHMRCPGVQPCARVVEVDPAADLQAAG